MEEPWWRTANLTDLDGGVGLLPPRTEGRGSIPGPAKAEFGRLTWAGEEKHSCRASPRAEGGLGRGSLDRRLQQLPVHLGWSHVHGVCEAAWRRPVGLWDCKIIPGRQRKGGGGGVSPANTGNWIRSGTTGYWIERKQEKIINTFFFFFKPSRNWRQTGDTHPCISGCF